LLKRFKIATTATSLVLAWLGLAAQASAQIYSWRDENGHLVLSDRPSGPVEHTYSVPKAESIRVTRPAAAKRTSLYDDLIVENARIHSVPPDLVRAVVQVESGFNPYARSPKGAMGLMQLMPATAREFGVTNPYNPEENIRAGVAYFRQLLDRYENNERLALAAYNAGPGAVDRHGQTVPPYRETQDYVSRIKQISTTPVEVRRSVIYKTTETIDGRVVTRYTDSKPANGPYEVVPVR
jgi:soluble lytic murein transglycosylase-like protein